MAFANDYRQYYPWQTANPAEQYASSAGNAAATQAAYNANQQRLAAQAAWQAQQQAATQNAYANRAELEKELANNEAEIRALQNELENMGSLDSIDNQLAANRARIGDFGNSRGHQNDIIARQNARNRAEETKMQWRWQADQNRIAREADMQKQAKADIKRIIGEIEDIDAQIPYHTEIGAQNALMAKRKRLVSELASYGVSAEAENNVETPVQGQGQDSVATLVQDEAAATDKKGLFTSPEKREEIAKAYEALGLKAEAKRVRNTLTAPEYKAKADKWKKDKEAARKLVGKYQNLTEEQRADFTSRWNRNDPNDAEIRLLRRFATYDGKTAPKMKGD